MADDAARLLANSAKVKLVGVYHLSVESSDARQLRAHAELLGSGIVTLEGLDLSQVSAGDYQLMCFPPKLATSDGAPARAILIG